MRRSGFTLMELLLVLAIIIITAAISVPVISTMLVDARMDAGADMVRARLADTRAKALETGVPWKIAYIPNSRVIQFAAEDSPEWDSASDMTPKETLDVLRDEMPPDIVLAPNRDDIATAQGTPQPSGSWQTLAIFTGDGSAREDATIYVGKAGLMPLRMRIRGLTGAVTMDVPFVVKDSP